MSISTLFESGFAVYLFNVKKDEGQFTLELEGLSPLKYKIPY